MLSTNTDVLAAKIMRLGYGEVKNILERNKELTPFETEMHAKGERWVSTVAFDIDINGMIYLFDRSDANVLIFSPKGELLSEIDIKKQVNEKIIKDIWLVENDISVDNERNIYLVDLSDKVKKYTFRILKFSPTGKYVSEMNLNELIKYIYAYSARISPDFFGNLYVYEEDAAVTDEHIDKLYIFDKNMKILKVLESFARSYRPWVELSVMPQRADSLGRVIYLRGQYLYASIGGSLNKETVMDSVKVPEKFLSKYSSLLGFDLNLNLYFEIEHYVEDIFETYMSTVYRLKIVKDEKGENQLLENGKIFLDFDAISLKNNYDDESTFRKRYIVAGNGEIYLLYQTMHKLYLDKITIR